MNINDLTKLVDDKIDQNPYKIVIEYYKVIMRVSKKELDEAVELIAVNDKIRMYKKWNLKMYKIIQN